MTAAADPVAAYLDRLSPSSRRTQRYAIRTVAALVAELRTSGTGWHDLDQVGADRVRLELGLRFRPATTSRYLAAFRGILNAAAELGLITTEKADRLAGKPRAGAAIPLNAQQRLGKELADIYRLPESPIVLFRQRCELCALWSSYGAGRAGLCVAETAERVLADGGRYRLMTYPQDGAGCPHFARRRVESDPATETEARHA